ncbi:MAG: ABC transporter substrate-binding protein [Candidatus Cloacimonetes bacterium]|nr:ABC transporter substrate-binding protein [Candidatus Cloacimonadota bacterium]
MRKKTMILVVIIALVMAMIIIIELVKPPKKITVGIVTWTGSGAIVGSSELSAAELYLEKHNNSKIKIAPVNDKWEPEETVKSISQAKNGGIKFFITSHPSKCAVASSHLFEDNQALAIVTGSASPALTGKNDYMFRIISDANREQKIIADYVNKTEGRKILIIQDSGNLPYTEPAFEKFTATLNEVKQWEVTQEKIIISDFDPESFKEIFAEDHDILYILAGSFQTAIGRIAQLFFYYHPSKPIILTPWARSASIVEVSGPSAKNIIIPSPYPCVNSDSGISEYFQFFKERFGYEPHSMTIGVWQAIELLDKAFEEGCKTPEDVKKYLLSKDTHITRLGNISFDRNGDVEQSFYFLNDLLDITQ